ncbi:MAG: FtsX-like permease family protein, partial [Clostridiaceae bacterium]|nr:FtsX-like permease family protein [Clostridiaceae bacterium]
ISYDKNQLNWAKTDLLYGKLDEDLMNEKNGVIAVHTTLRKGVTSRTAIFEFGDKVYADTPTGTKTLTVVGILRSLPFSDSKLNLTTFIATEKLFTELTGDEALKVIDIQLKGKNQEQTIREIKSIAGDSATFLDSRQKNDEMDKTFMTMAVFIYGFVIVIAFISLLNIVNTMNTSVAAKTRYYGVMRAVGMTGGQLDRMVLAEAAAYSLIGCFAGCVLGILLQRALINNFMTHFKMVWKFPLAQVILIFVLSMLVTAISVISPLKRVKARGIADVVNSL